MSWLRRTPPPSSGAGRAKGGREERESAVAYNSVISAWGSAGYPEEAEGMLQEMRKGVNRSNNHIRRCEGEGGGEGEGGDDFNDENPGGAATSPPPPLLVPTL